MSCHDTRAHTHEVTACTQAHAHRTRTCAATSTQTSAAQQRRARDMMRQQRDKRVHNIDHARGTDTSAREAQEVAARRGTHEQSARPCTTCIPVNRARPPVKIEAVDNRSQWDAATAWPKQHGLKGVGKQGRQHGLCLHIIH